MIGVGCNLLIGLMLVNDWGCTYDLFMVNW